MRIAVITEGSTKFHNKDVVAALDRYDHEVLNLGMKDQEGERDLTYIDTAFLSALLLNLHAVDLVVGGCGTGQGYMNAVLQYPNVFCGLLMDPVEAYLFSQVNAGNCISLQLNKGYGRLGGDINLNYMFDQLFGNEWGQGYPPARGEIQRASKRQLEEISHKTHLAMEEILEQVDDRLFTKVITLPEVAEVVQTAPESELKQIVLRKMQELQL